MHVSTDWIEDRDRHRLEHVEPARNAEIVELPPCDGHSEVRRLTLFLCLFPNLVQAQSIVERILPVIHYPFREVLDIQGVASSIKAVYSGEQDDESRWARVPLGGCS